MNKVDNEKSREELQGRYVYILSPVRNVTDGQAKVIKAYVEKLKLAGAKLFNPVDDAPQEDKTGYNIVMAELNFLHEAAKNGGRVDVLWNAGGKPSEGSRVDIGMALVLGLDLNLVHVFNEDSLTEPQDCLRLLTKLINSDEGKETETACEKMIEIGRSDHVTIDWDVEMNDTKQEWQRIYLGMALGKMVIDPYFKIKLGNVVGIDPPEKKSYVKVMREIEARQ